jgi:hypothetical protein
MDSVELLEGEVLTNLSEKDSTFGGKNGSIRRNATISLLLRRFMR